MTEILALKTAIIFCYSYFGWTLGGRMRQTFNPLSRWLLGAMIMLAIQSLWQTLFYYSDLKLNTFTDAVSLLLTVLTISPVVIRKVSTSHAETNKESSSWTWTLIPLSITILASTYIIRAAWLASTSNSISTPWPLLPSGTLFAIGAIMIAGAISAWKKSHQSATTLITIIGIISVVSIVPLIYTNGFGFDGFLHRASMNILINDGTLSPKPPYYIGLYVFETWLSRLADISIAAIDRWLMVFIMALVPLFTSWSVYRQKNRGLIALSTLLFLPIAPFVTTTPQAIAYIIGFFAICSALGNIHIFATLALACWSLAIHPLAGLPFLFVTLAILLKNHWIKWPLILAASSSVPLAFFVLGKVSDNQVLFEISRLLNPDIFQSIMMRIQPPINRVALWADAAALFELLRIPLLIIASAFAIKKSTEDKKQWTILFSAGVLLVLSGFILQTTGDFPFLIDYERGNYSERLFIVAQLLFLIPALAGIADGVKRIPSLQIISSIFLLFIVPVIASANIYTSLPRHDSASVSRGWSVSLYDKEAVQWIDRDAGSEPYTVLANQSVAAAAVERLGFKRYANTIFFYPIPTGGPLYQQFLAAMNPDNNLEPIKKAAELGQTKLVYVVLNDYWWNAKKVAEHLSSLANTEKTFGDNQVMIYRFEIN